MRERLEALLGIHDRLLNKSLSRFLAVSHSVTAVTTLKEMRAALEMTSDAQYAAACRYAVVIMEVNLGYPNTENIESAKMVYQHLNPLITGAQVKFTTVSGNDAVVEKALREGIPCVPKPDGILEYIRALQQ